MKKGFTLVEIVVVIVLLALIFSIAVPNIFKFSSRAKEKALKAKIDNLTKITEQYIENNSNDIVYKCQNNTNCICTNFSKEDSNYICILSIQKLVDLSLYSEKCDNNSCSCTIVNPTDSNNCLEDSTFEVLINLNNNTAIATFNE